MQNVNALSVSSLSLMKVCDLFRRSRRAKQVCVVSQWPNRTDKHKQKTVEKTQHDQTTNEPPSQTEQLRKSWETAQEIQPTATRNMPQLRVHNTPECDNAHWKCGDPAIGFTPMQLTDLPPSIHPSPTAASRPVPTHILTASAECCNPTTPFKSVSSRRHPLIVVNVIGALLTTFKRKIDVLRMQSSPNRVWRKFPTHISSSSAACRVHHPASKEIFHFSLSPAAPRSSTLSHETTVQSTAPSWPLLSITTV